jgi:hypothetical protein
MKTKRVEYEVGNYYEIVDGGLVKVVQRMSDNHLQCSDGFYRHPNGQFDSSTKGPRDFIKLYMKVE